MRTECFPTLIWLHPSQLPHLDLWYWQRKHKPWLLAEYLSSCPPNLAVHLWYKWGFIHLWILLPSWMLVVIPASPSSCSGAWRMGEAWQPLWFHRVPPWLAVLGTAYTSIVHLVLLLRCALKMALLPQMMDLLGGEAFQKTICALYTGMYV